MAIANPKKAVGGGLRGITQFIGQLTEYKEDQPNERFGGTQSHFLYTEAIVERAGKPVELKDGRLTDYVKESDEPNSTWMKKCAAFIDFALKNELLTQDEVDNIETGEDLMKPFMGKRIRYEKVVLVPGNEKISPGLSFVPKALVGESEEPMEPVYGQAAASTGSVSAAAKESAKVEVAPEAIELVASKVTDPDGLTKDQVKTMVMNSAANRALIISKGGGLDRVLTAAVSNGVLAFNGEVYFPAETVNPDTGEVTEVIDDESAA